jgi:hypothetical protein
MDEIKKGEIVIYKASSGLDLQVSIDGDTVWMSQVQISELFQTDRSSITKHIRNIFSSLELVESKTTLKQANVQKLHIGLDKPTTYYNLDVVISVGYRVDSKRATQFRIWATQRLKDYILKGYAVNGQRLDELKEKHNLHIKELQKTAKLFQNVIEAQKVEGYEKELLSIITDYGQC